MDEDALLQRKLSKIMESRPLTFKDLNSKLTEGRVVSVIILRADGTVDEIELNITPNLESAVQVLGGNVCLLGRWDDIEV